MARRPRASRLETRTARLKLQIAGRPYDWTALAPNVGIGYRRCKGAGRWVLRLADGAGGYATQVIGIADDYEDAGDGEHGALDFWQAQRRALKLARGEDGTASGPAKAAATLDTALTAYKARLIRLKRDPANESRVRAHATPSLLAKPLELLTGEVLTHWIDRLLKEGVGRANIIRMNKALRACLYEAADNDRRISQERRTEWRKALKPLPRDDDEDTEPRAVPADDGEVVALIAEAYALDSAFGLLVETLAAGSRMSQVARAKLIDLHDDGDDPLIFMPASRKGHLAKKLKGRAVRISVSHARKLRRAASERNAGPRDALLAKADGAPWNHDEHGVWTRNKAEQREPFAIIAAKIGHPEYTATSLRHWSIIRQIMRGDSLQEIAERHDTSMQVISDTYAREIAKRSALAAQRAREAVFDLAAQQQPTPPRPGKRGNVVRMRRRAG
jgi:hypothetical protein